MCLKKFLRPDEKRGLVAIAVQEHNMSECQACKLYQISTLVYRYKPLKKKDDQKCHTLLVQMAYRRPTWDFWMMYYRLRNADCPINHKRL